VWTWVPFEDDPTLGKMMGRGDYRIQFLSEERVPGELPGEHAHEHRLGLAVGGGDGREGLDTILLTDNRVTVTSPSAPSTPRLRMEPTASHGSKLHSI